MLIYAFTSFGGHHEKWMDKIHKWFFLDSIYSDFNTIFHYAGYTI